MDPNRLLESLGRCWLPRGYALLVSDGGQLPPDAWGQGWQRGWEGETLPIMGWGGLSWWREVWFPHAWLPSPIDSLKVLASPIGMD